MLSPNGPWATPSSFKSLTGCSAIPGKALKSCSWEVRGYDLRSRARNASLKGVPEKPYFSRRRFSR
jgi:hypothetical protein